MNRIVLSKPSSLMVVMIITMLYLVSHTSAIYQDPYSIRSDSDVIFFESFGFLKGGYFDMSININDRTNANNTDFQPKLLVCNVNEDEYDKDVFSNYCKSKPTCSIEIPLEANVTIIQHIHQNINVSGYYYFLLTQCSGDTILYTVSYALYNPGGNHLSYEWIPLPVILMVFTALWVILTGLWTSNWIMNRDQNVKLHKVITLYPFSKLAMVVYSLGYWRYLQTYGAVGLAVIILYWVFFIVFKVISCVVLLFIATGWGICKGRYEHLKKPLYLIIFLLVITLGLGAFFGGFFTILSLVVYIPVLCIIFIKSDRNVRLIRGQIQDLQNSAQLQTMGQSQPPQPGQPLPPPQPGQPPVQEVENPDGLPGAILTDQESTATNRDLQNRAQDNSVTIANLYSKLHMFIGFKWIMLVYLTLVIIIQFLSAAFNYGWVFEFFMLLVELCMFLCIGLTFRLRKEKLYYEFADDN